MRRGSRYSRYVDPQQWTQRDYNRIKDIDVKQGASSDPGLGLKLAETMANRITDSDKAYRRYGAATVVYHSQHPIAQVFYKRYLGIKNGTIEIKEPVKRVPKPEPVKPDISYATFGSDLEEKVGSDIEDQSLNEGQTTEGVIEIWKSWSSDIFHVHRTTPQPLAKIGAINNFNSKGSFLFGGQMVDWIGASYKKEAIVKYGNPEKSLIDLKEIIL